jgi:hypothetical protein
MVPRILGLALRTLRSPSFLDHVFDGLPHRGEKLLQLRWLLNVAGALETGTVLIARRLRRRDDGHWHMCQARGLLQLDEYLKAIALGRVQRIRWAFSFRRFRQGGKEKDRALADQKFCEACVASALLCARK